MRFTPSLAAVVAVAALTTAAGAQAARPDDPTIVAIFDAANTWDMETGALAASKGSTKAVRDFGEMLVRDHRQVRQQGRDLATKLHVTPTPPKDFAMAKDHEAAMHHLRGLSGAEFDKAFLTHEAAYHKAVVDAVTTSLLPATTNGELKKLQQDIAPAFQAHMLAAQNLLAKGS